MKNKKEKIIGFYKAPTKGKEWLPYSGPEKCECGRPAKRKATWCGFKITVFKCLTKGDCCA